jgi:hypothetical protein
MFSDKNGSEEAFNFDWIMPFEGKSSFSESISSRENLSKLFFCEIQRDSIKRKSRNSSLTYICIKELDIYLKGLTEQHRNNLTKTRKMVIIYLDFNLFVLPLDEGPLWL